MMLSVWRPYNVNNRMIITVEGFVEREFAGGTKVMGKILTPSASLPTTNLT
jgi:hypothetical protein